MTAKAHTSWLALPFVALWRLISLIVGFTGRLLAIVLGLILMIVGAVFTVSVVGAIIGIPLIVVGFMLTARGIF